MATRQNTNNAIPSNDLKDLNDNTIIIDEWTNGTVDYTQDRLGNQIKTRKKVVEDLDAYAQQIADGLFVPLDGSKAAKKVKIGTTTLTGDDGILKADDVKLLKDGDAVQLTADENGKKTVNEPTDFKELTQAGSGVVTKANFYDTLESVVLYPNGSADNLPTFTAGQELSFANPFGTENVKVDVKFVVNGIVGDAPPFFSFNANSRDYTKGILRSANKDTITISNKGDNASLWENIYPNVWGLTSALTSAKFYVIVTKVGN